MMIFENAMTFITRGPKRKANIYWNEDSIADGTR